MQLAYLEKYEKINLFTSWKYLEAHFSFAAKNLSTRANVYRFELEYRLVVRSVTFRDFW